MYAFSWDGTEHEYACGVLCGGGGRNIKSLRVTYDGKCVTWSTVCGAYIGGLYRRAKDLYIKSVSIDFVNFSDELINWFVKG